MRVPRTPVTSGSLALFFLLFSVFLCGMEAFLVQTFSLHHLITTEGLRDTASLYLLTSDFLLPLSLCLLSRRAFLIFILGQACVSSIILHYSFFFYNTLTLSTIYHSMQGLSYLGGSVFSFLRPDILGILTLSCLAKLSFLWLSALPHEDMPSLWQTRVSVSLLGFMLLSVMVFWGHGRSGILTMWTDASEHRTAEDRRTQEGTKESVRNLGYLATWAGEWMSGVYRDTSLIFAEKTCPDPHESFVLEHPDKSGTWNGFALPPRTRHIAMIQVESLDFSALSMAFNGRKVMPFLQSLLPSSVLLKAFAPHKVGSANSDYELLNGKEADQNVMYYSYIRKYPDSVVHTLADRRPVAFHGLEGNLFNLREAYALMGFADTFFKEDLVREGYPTSDLTMEHIKDEHVLDAAAKYLEQGTGQAVFVVTMSSHIPFMDPWPPFGLSGSMFARYVASLHYVDACLADFYARLPEDTLLVLWGDHSSDVPYPDEMEANGKHVPFLVHVKGSDAWLARGDTRPGPDREFTLCELSYALRRIVQGTQNLGGAEFSPGRRTDRAKENTSSPA